MAYRDGYARPNHLKSPQFFEEGYRVSGVLRWIRQTKYINSLLYNGILMIVPTEYFAGLLMALSIRVVPVL